MSIVRRLLVAGIALLIAAPMTASANHETLPPVQVMADSKDDGDVLGELQPDWTDLVAGYIAEDPLHLYFTWQVEDLPTGEFVSDTHLFWEFTLDDQDGIEDPVPFQVHAIKLRSAGNWTGILAGSCSQGDTGTSCEEITTAQMSVSSDPATNSATARVRRRDLKDPSGVRIANLDGTVLVEAVLYRGIGAAQGIGAGTGNVWYVSGAAVDEGDMTETEDGYYTLGR